MPFRLCGVLGRTPVSAVGRESPPEQLAQRLAPVRDAHLRAPPIFEVGRKRRFKANLDGGLAGLTLLHRARSCISRAGTLRLTRNIAVYFSGASGFFRCRLGCPL